MSEKIQRTLIKREQDMDENDMHKRLKMVPESAGEEEPGSQQPAIHMCTLCNTTHATSQALQHHTKTKGHQRRLSGEPEPEPLGRRPPKPGKSMADTHPHMLQHWDWEANGDLKPTMVTFSSTYPVAWHCPVVDCAHGCQHKFIMKPNLKCGNNGMRCPFCAKKRICVHNSLAHKRPDIAAMFHPTKNAELGMTTDTLSVFSNRVVWWKCDKQHPDCTCAHPHEWQVMLQNRTKNGTGCPFCHGRATCPCRSFGARFPDIAAEMDPSFDQPDPMTIPCSSHMRLWFKCSENPTHPIWEVGVSNRTTSLTGCPACSHSILEKTAHKILTDMGIAFITQYKFPDSRERFDFKIVENAAAGTPAWLLELDGLQHFIPSAFGSKKPGAAEKAFAYQRQQDKKKDALAMTNGMHLLRIPYTRGPSRGSNVCSINEDIDTFLQVIQKVTDSALVVHSDPAPYMQRDAQETH